MYDTARLLRIGSMREIGKLMDSSSTTKQLRTHSSGGNVLDSAPSRNLICRCADVRLSSKRL